MCKLKIKFIDFTEEMLSSFFIFRPERRRNTRPDTLFLEFSKSGVV